MASHMRELLRLDLDAVDLRKGVTGLAFILSFAVFVGLFGDVGLVAGLATLFVILADHPGPPRDRGLGVLVMTVLGSLIALLGVWAGPLHPVFSASLTGLVVALSTLAAGLGASYALRGMLLSVWVVLAISLAGPTETAFQLALAFAAGGFIAAAVLWLRTRALPEPSVATEMETAARSAEEVIRSPLAWFALLRGGAAGLALWLGVILFPAHPVWAALAVILVLKPKAGDTLASGLLRSVGTVIGVILAEVVILVADSNDAVVAIGLLVFAFAMTALQKVNYAVFVACLTALLVLADQFARGSGEATAADRLLATLLGAAIAVGVIAIARLMLGQPVTGTQTAPAASDDGVPG
jgi:uncharacterized membrane protein YccC